MLDDRGFHSVDVQTCTDPSGASQCHFELMFTRVEMGTYWGFHGSSDIAEGGAITCDGDTILGVTDGVYPHTAQYLPDVDHVVWDGVEYASP